MNINEANMAMDNNLKVLANTHELKNKPLWITQTTYCHNTDEGELTLRDSCGTEHKVDVRLVELLPNQKISTLSVKLDTNEIKGMLNQFEIRKEIAFLLIQNNYEINDNFKYIVDEVVHAIGESK